MSFTLPDNNVLISFSGGRTSAFMLYKILEAQNWTLPERCKVVFANTGREMPETLDFVQRCSDEWKVPITWVEYTPMTPDFKVVNYNTASRDGKPFEDMITKDNRVPDAVRRFCTRKLKIKPTTKYLQSLGWKKWSNALGIRADEARRIKDSPLKYITSWFPLSNHHIRKLDVLEFWSKQKASFGFDLMLTTTSNCDGCFLKSEANRASMWRTHPERMEWWAKMEKKTKGTFIYKNSYAELRDFVSRQGDWIFDTEGVLCQADDGECTG